MAQLPCIGLSCPLLNHIWGSCAIYFHHRGVVFNTYIPGFEAGRLQMDIWMDFWMIPDGLPVVRGFNLQYQKLILPSRHYSGQAKQWVNCCHFTTGPSFLRVIFWQQKNTPSLNCALNVVGKKKLNNIPQKVVSLMVMNPMVAYLSKNHLLQSTNPSQGGLSPRVEQLLPRFFFFRVKLLLMLQKSQCQPTVGCFWNLVNNGISTTFSSTGFLARFLVAINSVDAKRRDPNYRAPKAPEKWPEIRMGKGH